MIVAISQQKGGAGKSTLTAQLGVAIAASGKRTTLVDIDPQGTLGQWAGIREQRHDLQHTVAVESLKGWRLQVGLDELRRNTDIILIDTAPHDDTESGIAIKGADLVLIPCQPSLLDVWGTKPTIARAKAENRKVRLVFNRIPPRGSLIQETIEAVDRADIPYLACGLGNRQAFSRSMGQGKSVIETEPRSKAADELRALTDAVIKLIAQSPFQPD